MVRTLIASLAVAAHLFGAGPALACAHRASAADPVIYIDQAAPSPTGLPTDQIVAIVGQGWG